MAEIIVKENPNIVRRQILVVQVAHFTDKEYRDALRAEVLNQMKEGLVILPIGCTGFACDADTVMLMEKEAEG